MPNLDPVSPLLKLHAFTGYGIELEYMIVDRDTLAAMPLADRLLTDTDGAVANEVDHGELAWSNELVQHVVELKTNGPANSLIGLGPRFHRDIVEINDRLLAHNARLLPTAMHPLFDPDRETRLWPFGQNDIYEAYDRIFGCRGHGWSNLQSMHINLPFYDDEEFRRLHAAIRPVLALIPALAAASPLEQGRRSAWLDGRLRYYRDNQKAIPEISGLVIPEPVEGIADYHARILKPMYAAIRPHDPTGILVDDWLNSRGAIARFERQTIEIRVIDLQECPNADLAIAEVVVALVQAFHDGKLASFEAQQQMPTQILAEQLWACARHGSQALVESEHLLRLFGKRSPLSAGELWRQLLKETLSVSPAAHAMLDQITTRGSLAESIAQRLGPAPKPAQIRACYEELAECLSANRLFHS